MTKLAGIMTSRVFTVSPASVAETAATMVRGGFGSAVVVQGSLIEGIFTERDVLRAAASGVDLTVSPVSRWMTRDLETAEPDDDSERAAEPMLAGGFRRRRSQPCPRRPAPGRQRRRTVEPT